MNILLQVSDAYYDSNWVLKIISQYVIINAINNGVGMMYNLYKNQKDGLGVAFSFGLEYIDSSIVVEFVKSYFSDYNKWKESQVLTDLRIDRYLLPSVYGKLDPKGLRLRKYIISHFDTNLQVIKDIEGLSKSHNHISISMPTSKYILDARGFPKSTRPVKNSIFPLIVNINDRDVSSAFMDFGDFGSNAVKVAYDALIKGNLPISNKDLFYKKGVEQLHKEYIQAEVDEPTIN